MYHRSRAHVVEASDLKSLHAIEVVEKDGRQFVHLCGELQSVKRYADVSELHVTDAVNHALLIAEEDLECPLCGGKCCHEENVPVVEQETKKLTKAEAKAEQAIKPEK